jgi:hypothetical protein
MLDACHKNPQKAMTKMQKCLMAWICCFSAVIGGV